MDEVIVNGTKYIPEVTAPTHYAEGQRVRWRKGGEPNGTIVATVREYLVVQLDKSYHDYHFLGLRCFDQTLQIQDYHDIEVIS